MKSLTPVSPAAAYDLWSANYDADLNPIPVLEERAARALSPDPAGRRLLDAGCGTGRRLPPGGFGVGIDVSGGMLLAARRRGLSRVIRAGVERLPFFSGVFDLVWCRLVLGHVASLEPAVAELARVLSPGGTLLVTDFHPGLVAAGLRRTFVFEGERFEVETHPHSEARLDEAAGSASLRPLRRMEMEVAEGDLDIFQSIGRPDLHSEFLGRAIVLAQTFERDPS